MLRDLILVASKETYHKEWERHMNDLKRIKPKAYEKLLKIPQAKWARFAIQFTTKVDMIVNNISKSFNDRTLKVIDKPIITMLEWIRL